jgi:hypothetical protein
MYVCMAVWRQVETGEFRTVRGVERLACACVIQQRAFKNMNLLPLHPCI